MDLQLLLLNFFQFYNLLSQSSVAFLDNPFPFPILFHSPLGHYKLKNFLKFLQKVILAKSATDPKSKVLLEKVKRAKDDQLVKESIRKARQELS